jgi:effector-binding domain-containing protein
MPETPQIEQRGEQRYVAIRVKVPMNELAAAVDRGFPELFGWLQARGAEPSGPPFIRYLEVEMNVQLEVDLAVPIATELMPEPPVRADTLPGGRYVTLLHVGPYEGLVAANATLQAWAQEQGIAWDMDGGSVWRGRVEHYLTDPSQDPNPSRWETELAYLAADGDHAQARSSSGRTLGG